MIAGGRHHEEISGGGSPRASVSERSGPSGAVDRPRLHHTEAKRERSGEGKRARLQSSMRRAWASTGPMAGTRLEISPPPTLFARSWDTRSMPSLRTCSRGRVMAGVPDAPCSRSFRSAWSIGYAITKSKSWPSRTVDDARATGDLGSEQPCGRYRPKEAPTMSAAPSGATRGGGDDVEWPDTSGQGGQRV